MTCVKTKPLNSTEHVNVKAPVSGTRQEGGKEKGITCDCIAASWKLSYA